MASTDAKLVPTKNAAYRVTFPILDADGDLVTGATGLDSEVSKDGGAFADCTNEATEIATSSGIYYLDLTATEMNADTVAVIVKTSSSGAKTTPLVFYPQESGDLLASATIVSGGLTAASLASDVQLRLGIVASGTAQAATATTLQLASASAFADDELNGAVVVITGGTTGVGQSRVITDYASATDTATVDTWTTTPSGTITYVVLASPPASATALPAVNVTQFGGAAGTFASGRPEVSPADGSIAAATFAAGAITATVIATGALDADALAADAVTEIAAGVLVAAASTPIDANVQEINDVAITGDGSATPFNVV